MHGLSTELAFVFDFAWALLFSSLLFFYSALEPLQQCAKTTHVHLISNDKSNRDLHGPGCYRKSQQKRLKVKLKKERRIKSDMSIEREISSQMEERLANKIT